MAGSRMQNRERASVTGREKGLEGVTGAKSVTWSSEWCSAGEVAESITLGHREARPPTYPPSPASSK